MNSDPNKNENRQDPLLIDHEADGIQELDNLLPRWWVWLFYITIIYGFGYMVYYHVAKMGRLQAAEYVRDAAKGEEIKNAALAKFESTIATLEPSRDSAVLSSGQSIFMKMCAPCHRADGGGLVGPNLCDDYWMHGSNYVDNLKTIVNGVPEKGMITWRGVLKPNEIQAAASYIYTLRGTHPDNPKPSEDHLVPETKSEFE
jgi:cytochrome c oxidase cbb3-type subunit 3